MVRQPKADLHSIISCSNNLPLLQCSAETLLQTICIADNVVHTQIELFMMPPATSLTRKPETKIFQKFLVENISNLFMVPDQIMNYDVEKDYSNHLWRLSELTDATTPSIYSKSKHNVLIELFGSRSKKGKFRAPPFFIALIGNNHAWASWWRDPPRPRWNNKHSSPLLVRDTVAETLSLFTANYPRVLRRGPRGC